MSNPTTHVESFSGSLGGFSGVDPIRYDGGLWLEQGATNMWPNPDAFVDTAGVATDLGVEGTLSRDVSSGVTSFHLERTGAGGNPTNLYNSARVSGIAGGDELVLAADIRSPDAGGGIRLVCQLVTWTDADVFVSSDFGSSIPITSSYARYESKFVVPATAGKGIWVFRFEDPGGLSVPVGADIYIRRIQVEASGYATSPAPEVDGSGVALAGYAFTGTAHASSSTRAASSAAISPSGHIDPATGSLALQLTRVIDTGAEELYFECGTVGSGTDALRGGVDASDHPFVEWNSNNAGWERLTSTATVTVDTEFVYLTDWTGTVTRLQIDDAAIESGTRDATEGDWGAGDLVLEAA